MTSANNSSPGSGPSQAPALPTRRPLTLAFRIRRRTAVLARWLHVYLSMASFAVILFFAVTGLTLNHPDWFAGRDRVTHYTGTVPAPLLHPANAAPPDKLGIVELLRSAHKITGSISDFRADDGQIAVSFKGPGYTADAFIDPSTGAYDLDETRSGFLAVINDLHRGQNTGKVWSAVIDVSAIFLTLVSLTGLILIWFIHKRRTAGLTLAFTCAALCYILYRVFVR